MYVFSHSVESDFRDPMNYSLPGSSVHGILQTGSHSLLQGIFPTQGLNQGLLHCSQILYHLSQQGSPNKCILQFHLLTREGNGNPLQCSCLKNPMGRGAWRATVYAVAKSRTRLSDFQFHFQSNESCSAITGSKCN